MWQVLPSLVRMCKKDKTWEQRVEGAETLAYLIETDPSLQQTAVIADQLIPTLLEYFKYPGNPLNPVLMPKVKVSEVALGLPFVEFIYANGMPLNIGMQ
jgi:hypothetical protein